MRETLQVVALPGYEPEIGRWLWAMEETRRHTLRLVSGLDQATLDWEGPTGDENAIGSLLYHMAVVELSWLFEDILEQDLPADVAALFPIDSRGTAGRLSRVLSMPLEDHLGRLHRSREIFLDRFRSISLHDWRVLRSPGDVDYDVTPEWAVFHLVEHEAGHAFQIASLKARAAGGR